MEDFTGILLADDDPDFALLVRIAFESAAPGQRLEVVSDGDEAIDRLRGGSVPRMILLDQRLPRVSGLEVVRWIRERPAWDSIPVIVITGLAQEGDRERALRAGATEFLVKPLEYSCLIPMLRALSARWLFTEDTP